MTTVVNINEVLDGHVGLRIECIDRLYLNAYVPNLQVGGQVTRFLRDHLGHPVVSPALLEKIGNRFRREVKAFAEDHDVPMLTTSRADRAAGGQLAQVAPYLAAAERAGRTGVVAIVSAQEFQWVFSASNRSTTPGVVCYSFAKAQRRVGAYYFYVLDGDFGPGFIKICTYFPYPAKVWCNGHEWAKRQAAAAGIGFKELANGFAACERAEELQAICDRLGPEQVQSFFDRWMAAIPTPLTTADQDGGYWWELSVRQVELASTSVFDDSRRARSFFEALVADNIGIGRPSQVSMVFARRITKKTPGPFATRVFGPGTEVCIDLRYRSSRVKQYLKEAKALRTETVINKPSDIGVRSRLCHLPELVAKGHEVNRRLLMIERAGQGCAIGSALFERIHQPYNREGHRTGALRFGDPRAMALAGALCMVVHAVTGFTNKSLRGLVAGLLGSDYTSGQMTYDLRRLRLHGLIERIPRTNTYVTTSEGLRTAVFFTKLDQRLLHPLLAADQLPAPPAVRRALSSLDKAVGDYVAGARLGAAA